MLSAKVIIIRSLWFIRSSISLDLNFFLVSNWPVSKKLELMFKKYVEIFLLISGLKTFELSKNFVWLFGNKIYYDSPYGIAGYQSMLARQQRMFKFAGPENVKTIVDIGANVGFFSMMLRELYPKARIFAVEPVPKIFENLKRNLNSPLDKTFNIAMSNRTGGAKMSFDERESAFSHIVDSDNRAKLPDVDIIPVGTVTLDEFCKKNGIKFIDILKIDTEGFEANVLRGAKNTLSKTKYLHIEITLEYNTNYTFSEINSLLYSKNYNFQLVYFRNFTGKGCGVITVGEFLYRNARLD